MEWLRQISAGFVLAAFSVLVVLGGFVQASTEGGMPIALQPTSTIPSAVSLPTGFSTIAVHTETPSAQISAVVTDDLPTQTFTPAPTTTPPPTPASCLPPIGWVAVLVQPSDSMATLAQDYQTSPTSIKQGNCLFSDQLVSGSLLYLPARPTATSIPCGAPVGWVSYTVQSGDTLFNISGRYTVSVADLQKANCLGNSSYIQAGKPIKVPYVVTNTPLPTVTPIWTSSPTSTRTPTPIVILPSVTPTKTATPINTVTPTAAPTNTATETPTIAIPTDPPTPTVTPTV
jgi:LysM repeat protein